MSSTLDALEILLFIYFLKESSVDVYMHSAPFRWKQYDAYVQVLEAKYADLCCKSITNILLFTSVQRHFLHIGQFRMAFNVLPDVSLFTFF